MAWPIAISIGLIIVLIVAAVWYGSSLKNKISSLTSTVTDRLATIIELKRKINQLQLDIATSRAQLSSIRKSHNELLTRIENGNLLSSRSIAAALRSM